MGWEWNQLTTGSFLNSVIGSNPSQNPQGNAGSRSFLGTGPIVSLKSSGCFVVTLLEAWEGFKPGTSQSGVHAHPLQYVTRGYLLRSRTGSCWGRRMHLLTVLSPVAIPTKEEKVEGSHAPDAEIKPTSRGNERQSPEVRISLTRYWLPRGSAQPTAGWGAPALSGHSA